jgi:hypothetical protein
MKTRVLLHPLALAALALLVVNDHVLKYRYPGLITGKLSDVAGMILAPLVLFVIVPERFGSRRVRAWSSVLVVAIAFALTKTWHPATRFYEWSFETLRAPLRFAATSVLGRQSRPMWSERVMLVCDPTDLVALPFGFFAGVIGAGECVRRSITTTLASTISSIANATITRRVLGGFGFVSSRTRSG